MEVNPYAIGANTLGVQSIQQSVNVSGGAVADGVSQTELVTAQVHHPGCDVHDLVNGDLALPGVAEAHRDVCTDPQILGAGPLDDGREHRDGLSNAAVEVLAGEGLRRAAEDRDGLDTLCQCPVQTPLVGHQDWSVATTADLAEQGEKRSGVGELGDPRRWHERRRLDGVEPCGHQAPDELGLDPVSYTHLTLPT